MTTGARSGYPGRMLAPYAPVFERLDPYVVGTQDLLARLDVAPLGVEIAAPHRIDPTRAASGPFLDLVERLDGLTFGPLGMGMPRWALYDCGELPGMVFGFASEAGRLLPRLRRALDLPDGYAGLVPLSMFISIPTLEPGHWLGHSICSLNEVSPGAAPPRLRLLSVALGLTCLGARAATGSMLWSSPKLEVLARFAPLRLQAALLPAHTEPASCVFSFDVDGPRIERALALERASPEVERWLDVDDAAALEQVQGAIEGGEPWCIVGPPEVLGATRRVPLARQEVAS